MRSAGWPSQNTQARLLPSVLGGPPGAPHRLKLNFRLGIADRLILALSRNCVDHDRVPVDTLNGAADRDLRLWSTHAAELDREPFERAGVAVGNRGVGAGDQAHHVEAVQ